MRINQMEKALKHFLKRKVSVNQAVVVGFLIMGMGAFANTIEIGSDEYSSQISVVGRENVINHGAISSITTGGNNSGNGILSNAGTTSIGNSVGNIENAGVISGTAGGLGSGIAHTQGTGDALGNGIIQSNTSTANIQGLGNIENTGIIKGSVVVKSSVAGNQMNGYGNGIAVSARNSANGDLVVGNITNTSGVISGNFQTDGKIEATMKPRAVGNGIGISITASSGTATAVIGAVENHGKVLGNVEIQSKDMDLDFRVAGNGLGFSSANPIGDRKNLESVKNTGVISGNVSLEIDKFSGSNNMWLIGNGLGGLTTTAANGIKIGDISNDGIISGNMNVELEDSIVNAINGRAFGNGIVAYTGSIASATIGSIKNTGKVVGNYTEDSTIVLGKTNNSFGNGIYSSGTIEEIINTGLIAGSNHAVYADSVNNEILNYGVLAGQTITNKPLNKTNHGVEIVLNNDGTVASIVNGADGGEIDGKIVINATLVGSNNSYVTAGINYTNNIINGVGTDKGVLNIISGTTTLENSIVNAYNTAISLQGSSTLNAKNTTFNGGGLEGKVAVIKTEGNNNKVSITENSVVNGDISVNGNTNTVSIGTNVAFNGNNIEAVGTGNTLNLGDVVATKEIVEPSLNIYGNISGFENLNIKGNVSLFETAKLEGVKDLNLAEGSDLLVRIDATLGEKEEGKGYSGHALYETGSEVTGTGTLTFGIAGIGDGKTIALGDTKIDSSVTIESNILGRDIVDIDGSLTIERNVDRLIDPTTNVVAMKNVLNSLYDSGSYDTVLLPTVEIGPTSGKTSAEATKALNIILDSLITGNLATAAQRASKASMETFNDVAINNPFTPTKGQWLVDGGATYNDSSSDFTFMETASVNGELGIDYNSFNGYGKMEYGYTDRTSVGTVFGGGKSKIENDFGSELDGNSAYIGLYAKHKTSFWNWDIYAGAGYQHTDYDGTKVSGNQYQTIRNDQDFSVKGYTMYAGASKAIEIGRGFMWEPKAKITYTSLKQDEINETGELAMNVASKDVSYLETELGANLRRDFKFATGVGRARVGISWNILLDDHFADTMEASFVAGGDSFELLVPQTDRSRTKLDLSYEFEKSTGWSYSLGATYGHGKMTKDFTARLGAGYKF